jgi:hypothetical protein
MIILAQTYSTQDAARMDDLDKAIREFTPMNGVWLPLETYFEQAFGGPDPKKHYRAFFVSLSGIPTTMVLEYFGQRYTAWKRLEAMKSCSFSIS